MKRRTTDPLAPLLPVVRVAAVGLVAAGATLAVALSGAAHASAQPGPAASKLSAIAIFPQSAKRADASATITDKGRIERAADLINALPPAPTGVFSCPAEWGGALKLGFETADGTLVEQVTMAASGCGGSAIVINGEQQSERVSGPDTIRRVQAILGTDWQLSPMPPS